MTMLHFFPNGPYHLEKGEDYERMMESDLQDILDIVKALNSLA